MTKNECKFAAGEVTEKKIVEIKVITAGDNKKGKSVTKTVKVVVEPKLATTVTTPTAPTTSETTPAKPVDIIEATDDVKDGTATEESKVVVDTDKKDDTNENITSDHQGTGEAKPADKDKVDPIYTSYSGRRGRHKR